MCRPEITKTPAVFTSVTAAWSNRSRRRLSEHVKSSCFFAHVRAAPPGSAVSEENCHPFQYDRFLWMHNGTIEGTTDSEHAFAMFLDLMERSARAYSSGDDRSTGRLDPLRAEPRRHRRA